MVAIPGGPPPFTPSGGDACAGSDRSRGQGATSRPRLGRSSARPGEAGAATVEFAFALLFILLLFIAYVNISEIFLAHSRLRYAAFAASRTHAAGGSARRAADAIAQNFRLKTTSDTVRLEQSLDLPKAVGTFFGTGDTFTIRHAVKTFVEPVPSGDNAAR